MHRGRPPAETDEAAIAARAKVENFMKSHDYRAKEIAFFAKVSGQTVMRALTADPPVWTPGFRKIVDYINSKNNENSGLIELAATLREQKGDARAVAALLRAVATLLERP